MKDIRFRGQRTDGTLVYGPWIEFNINEELSFIGHAVPNQKAYEWEDVLTKTVGEYTGLQDKERSRFFPHGKDIYEGDVIDGNLFDRRIPTRGEVVFDQEHACYGSKNLAGITPLTKIAEIEIIGNKWANPELLK